MKVFKVTALYGQHLLLRINGRITSKDAPSAILPIEMMYFGNDVPLWVEQSDRVIIRYDDVAGEWITELIRLEAS